MGLYIADDIKVWFLCILGLFRTNFCPLLYKFNVFKHLFCIVLLQYQKRVLKERIKAVFFTLIILLSIASLSLTQWFFFIICQELKSRIWSSTQVRKMCASTINYLNLLGYFLLENKQKHSE